MSRAAGFLLFCQVIVHSSGGDSSSLSISTLISKYLLPWTRSSLISISIALTNLSSEASFGNSLKRYMSCLLTSVHQKNLKKAKGCKCLLTALNQILHSNLVIL